MRWEDQELNHTVGDHKFREVVYAGLFLASLAAKQQGKFMRLDQAGLDMMVQSGELTERAKGVRIDRLCLYYRLFCRLGPGGDHYPVGGVMHFWRGGTS